MAQMVAPTRERDPDSRFVLLVRSHAVQRLIRNLHLIANVSAGYLNRCVGVAVFTRRFGDELGPPTPGGSLASRWACETPLVGRGPAPSVAPLLGIKFRGYAGQRP